MTGQTDLEGLLSTLRPDLRPGNVVYCTAARALEQGVDPLATITESGGHHLRPPARRRRPARAPVRVRRRLDHSPPPLALDAVGLTAAVSTALASAGIACNVLAGYFHDHLIVPADRAADALDVLTRLAGKMTA